MAPPDRDLLKPSTPFSNLRSPQDDVHELEEVTAEVKIRVDRDTTYSHRAPAAHPPPPAASHARPPSEAAPVRRRGPPPETPPPPPPSGGGAPTEGDTVPR